MANVNSYYGRRAEEQSVSEEFIFRVQHDPVSGAAYHASLRGLTQESAEGDDRRHAGAVEEEERGQTLQADGIREVGDVVRGLSLDVHE